MRSSLLVLLAGATLMACSSAASNGPGRDGGAGGNGSDGGLAGGDDLAGAGDLATAGDAALPADTLDGNRDRLLASYLAYLQAHPGAQSNGLDGAALAGVCDLWTRLDPSSQRVFLTLTARLQGSTLDGDGSPMLGHVARVYRIAGGQNATASDAGSCGGGEYNRMIMSMDPTLHDALVAHTIGDVPGHGAWRDSHDLGGPHAPFDLSDETNDGAPRGQVQYFSDPASAVANAPLGRMDLTTLVDPLALEMDHDYDCVHNSNPSCSYVTYGPLCAPETSKLGVDLYESSYGTIESGWHPSGC